MLQNFYGPLLNIHSWLRWLVLAAGLLATFVALSGWSGNKTSNGPLRRFSVMFVGSMDLQLLLGLVLFFAASPLTQQALSDMGAAMKVRELRFFAVEHTALMLLAVILAHVGAVLAKKGKTVAGQYRGAAVCFALSLSLVLAGIPWWRPLFRLG
jgi:hypothetical protein